MSGFEASTAYVEPLSRIFKAVSAVSNEGLLVLDESGIKVQVSDTSHAFATFIFIPPEIFALYTCMEHYEIKIDITKLALCLKMYFDWSPLSRRTKRSAESQCVFQYTNIGEFELRFSQDSMTSVCLFSVFSDPELDADVAFDSDDVMLHTIMPGAVFENLLREFIALEAAELTIRTSDAPRRLHFAAPSDLAATEITLREDPKLLTALNVQEPASFTYNFKTVCKAREAAKLASQVSMRFDSQGVLSIQLIYEFDEQKVFVEFRFLPLVK